MRFQRGTLRAVFVLLLSIPLAGCGGRSLNKNSAQDLTVQLSNDMLQKEDVYIESVAQTGERDAVVEARLRTAFRFEKIGGKWVIKEVRVGHDQWENLEDFLLALNEIKIKQTGELLERVSLAIERYRTKNGALPPFSDFVTLTDALNPDYLTPLIRLDAWRRPFAAEKTGPDSVRLISAGPDGKLGTSDDIVITKSY
jgi:hypothetical protein